VLLTIFRGSSTFLSPIGIVKCSYGDWLIIAAYLAFSCGVTFLATYLLKKEYLLKKKYNKGLCDSDIKPVGKTLAKLIIFAFLGGWVSGALGLGGGSIFNPVLLSLGMAPSPAASTSKYMIMYSKVASCLIYFVYGQLNWQYGLWVAAWGASGSLILLYFI